MKRKRFSQKQIIKILQKADTGLTISEIYRKYGFSDSTFYNWKAKYCGLGINEARRLKIPVEIASASMKPRNDKLRFQYSFRITLSLYFKDTND